MRHRKLRIAWSVLWGLATVLLVALWIRSYWTRDRFAGQLTETGAFHIDSFVGRMAIAWRARPQNVEPLRSEFSTHKDPEGFWNRNDNILGFRIEGDPGTTFVSVPFWFLSFLTSSLCSIPWLPRPVSRRTLLIATMLLAAILGLVIGLAP